MSVIKKRIIIASVVLLSLALICVICVSASEKFLSKEEDFFNNNGKTVVATVNGKDIYNHQVETVRTFQELSKENAEKAENGKTVSVQSKEEILDDIIRDEILFQKAKKLNLTADYNEAEKFIKDSFEMIKQKNDENTEFLNKYIKELDITEEEYLEQATNAYRNQLTKAALYDWYVENNKDEAEIEKAYSDYTEKLVKSADIKIK